MTLRENALKQMANISVAEIRELIQRLDPQRSEKMIIDDNAELIISNYFYIKYTSTSIARQTKRVVFPLFPFVSERFSFLEKNKESGISKMPLEDNKLIEDAANMNCLPEDIEIFTELPDVFDFPVETETGHVFKSQPYYYIPQQTSSCDCPKCNGEKYLICDNPSCAGKHSWECPDCRGTRLVNCTNCSASGFIKCKTCNGRGEDKCKVCQGSSQVKCSHCGGDGYVGKKMDDESNRCSVCEGKGIHTCRECHHGFIKCESCFGKGEIKCSVCKGVGKVDCINCKSSGTIVCEKCYGDQEKFGKIDCPVCRTNGRLATLVYVETTVNEHNRENVICKNVKLNMITDEQIIQRCNRNGKTELCYSNINGDLNALYDEFSGDFAPALEKELKLHKDSYPRLLHEEVYYEMVPCVHLSYTHMLSNTVHEFTIINFFTNPSIVFHTEPEEIKANIGTAVKSFGNVFGKLFNTKTYAIKQDKITEIRLMIYVAKADGAIKESEKEFIASYIGSLDDFTNKEKKELFALLEIKPPLTIAKQDVAFSEHANRNEVLSNITKVALLDGSLDNEEIIIIESIKRFLL
jgi:uncharacterized tellurite resistance protein B-like protein